MSLEKYTLGRELGHGTFGVVVKATQKATGKLVALKKFILHDKKEGFPITAFREITILRNLRHLNVIQIIEVVYDDMSFYTVAPYISSDLNGLLHNPRITLSLSQIKLIMYQLLEGVNYIHERGYLHRDIKTANILLDHFGVIKVADFGLARCYHGSPPIESSSPPGGGFVDYTAIVVTRWYRSPELLLGDKKYTTAVDIWGVGCIFAELFIKRPLFEGQSDLHQAELIFQLMGSPTQENFPNCHLINRNNVNLKIVYQRTFESKFSNDLLGDKGAELLSGLLTLNPLERFNAIRALKSEWFAVEPVKCEVSQLMGLEESHESDVNTYQQQQATQQNSSSMNRSNINNNKHEESRIVNSNSNNNSNSGRDNNKYSTPWNKPVSVYDYDINSKRDREDPYFFANGGKRQRTDLFVKKGHLNKPKPNHQPKPLVSNSKGMYGGSNGLETSNLSLLRGMLHNNNSSNNNGNGSGAGSNGESLKKME